MANAWTFVILALFDAGIWMYNLSLIVHRV